MVTWDDVGEGDILRETLSGAGALGRMRARPRGKAGRPVWPALSE